MKNLIFLAVLVISFFVNPIHCQDDYDITRISHRTTRTRLSNVEPINNIFIFQASNGINGSELWKTDGTERGTQIIKDITPGNESSKPFGMIKFKNEIFFGAGKDHHRKLWKTNGSPGKTVIVKESESAFNGYNPKDLTIVGDTLYFSSNELIKGKSSGPHLWKSNGTADGTVLIKEIYPKQGGVYPENLTNCNGNLVFTVRTHNSSGKMIRELWKTDGTSKGTHFLYTFKNRSMISMVSFQNMVIFHDSGELWKTDGTMEGTFPIKIGVKNMSRTIVVGNTLYFISSGPFSKTELWKTDATEQGTIMYKEMPGHIYGYLEKMNDHIFFSAYHPQHGVELWKSNGTEKGTTIVKDILPMEESAHPKYLCAMEGTLFFVAKHEKFRIKIWQSDGTEEGTKVVKSGVWDPWHLDEDPESLVKFNDKVLFYANGGKLFSITKSK